MRTQTGEKARIRTASLDWMLQVLFCILLVCVCCCRRWCGGASDGRSDPNEPLLELENRGGIGRVCLRLPKKGTARLPFVYRTSPLPISSMKV